MFSACTLAQVRGLKKRKAAADDEAKLVLEEYESTLKQLGIRRYKKR